MKDFKVSRFYLVLMAGIVVTMLSVQIMFFMADPGTVHRVERFLGAMVTVIAAFILVYMISVKLRLDGNTIRKSTCFGTKELSIPEIVDITMLNLRGRYVFLLITMDKFTMISSTLGEFKELFHSIRSVAPSEPVEKIKDITDDMISQKDKMMKAIIVIVFLLMLVGAGYYYMRLWEGHLRFPFPTSPPL